MEVSGYGALQALLNFAGERLSPHVHAVVNPRNRGEGRPDGGLFTSDQLRREGDRELDDWPAQLSSREPTSPGSIWQGCPVRESTSGDEDQVRPCSLLSERYRCTCPATLSIPTEHWRPPRVVPPRAYLPARGHHRLPGDGLTSVPTRHQYRPAALCACRCVASVAAIRNRATTPRSSSEKRSSILLISTM